LEQAYTREAYPKQAEEMSMTAEEQLLPNNRLAGLQHEVAQSVKAIVW